MIPLSVIIPTHRRAKILNECLRHLELQTIVSDMEVIVMNDGGDTETEAISNTVFRIPVRFFSIPPCHQGRARNEGLQYVKGKYVLFIGDDIFLEPGACEKHLEAHKSCERSAVSDEHHHSLTAHSSSLRQGYGRQAQLTAVLGFTTWDPDVGITPVMRWLEKSGWQFGYPEIAHYAGELLPNEIQHRFTYTSHISLPLEIAKKFPFRTDVHLYGWEDIEWGMRLRNAGIRLFYQPEARAVHHHVITAEDSLRRMETLGRSAVDIAKQVPGFDRVPTGWKLFAYKVASVLPTFGGSHRKAFLRGAGL